MTDARSRGTSEWLNPPVEQGGLAHYVETIRQRIGIVLTAVAVTTAIAVIYIVLAPKTYEAVADVLITPVPDSSALGGLGLIQQSSDPTRDVETAARLITTTNVASKVAADLKLTEPPRSLLSSIEATPVAQSNIVSITATADSPEAARDLANSFATNAQELRTQSFQTKLKARIAQIRIGSAGTLGDQGDQLRSFVGAADPTFSVSSTADLPRSPASPRPVLSVVAGLLSGLIAGIAGAFISQSLDTRVRREEQLRRRYRLPILARIPREPTRDSSPLGPQQVSSATAEAYRTLRATLRPRGPGGGRVILITGSSASEGKTTSAVNLAASLALAGNRVIIVEADLRRPALAKTLGINMIRGGVVGVLLGNLKLEDALTTTAAYGSNLRALVADYDTVTHPGARAEMARASGQADHGGWIADLFTIPAAKEMIVHAAELADYVIIDSPPLSEVVDALPLAQQADDVLIVVRLGKSRLENVSELGELLAESGVRPAGFVVIGVPQPSRGEYHYYGSFAGDGNGTGSKPSRKPSGGRSSTDGIFQGKGGKRMALKPKGDGGGSLKRVERQPRPSERGAPGQDASGD